MRLNPCTLSSSLTGVLTVLCLAHAGAPAFASDLIVNGSFETGDFVNSNGVASLLSPGANNITGWTVITDQIGWVSASLAGVSAADGDKYLELTSDDNAVPHGGVSQLIATAAGQEYTLRFALGSGLNAPPPAVIVTAANSSVTFSSASSGPIVWNDFELPFTALSSSTLISFQGISDNFFIGLDKVSVTPKGIDAPEPSSLVFAGIAGLAVGGLILRRRAR